MANVYELLGETGSGSTNTYGLYKDEEKLNKLIESLKGRGYTVRTPGEVIEELRKDLIEERTRRQELEARVRSLEISINQTTKVDWMPVILLVIILLSVLMILALQHFLHSRNEDSNTKKETNRSEDRGA